MRETPREKRARENDEKRIKLRLAEDSLDRELQRQEIAGRDIERLVEVVVEKIWPSALPVKPTN